MRIERRVRGEGQIKREAGRGLRRQSVRWTGRRRERERQREREGETQRETDRQREREEEEEVKEEERNNLFNLI